MTLKQIRTSEKAAKLIEIIDESKDKLDMFKWIEGNNIPCFSNRKANEKVEAHLINIHRELELLQELLLIEARKELKYGKPRA